MWRLPGGREKDSFWRYSVGPSTVKAAVQTPVMVYAWNGNKKVTALMIRTRLSFVENMLHWGSKGIGKGPPHPFPKSLNPPLTSVL